MKNIYLKDSKGLWELFQYNTLTDIAGEFASRSIWINDKLQVLGDNAMIGNRVTIEATTTIGKSVTINDDSVIGSNGVIMDKVKIGSNVTTENDVIIASECYVGNGVTLRSGIRLGKLAKVEDDVDLQHKFLIVGSVGEITYVGNDKICIGCTSATIPEWEKSGRTLGRDFGYTDDQIGEYVRYVYLAKDFIDNINTPA